MLGIRRSTDLRPRAAWAAGSVPARRPALPDGRGAQVRAARVARIMIHEFTWKQKSPPDGGRAVDDRMLIDQSRHRAARACAAPPPAAGGRRGGDGDQVRHANRVARAATCPRSTRQTVDGLASADGIGRATSGCSSMVEQKPSKLTTRVRFPSPAPNFDQSGDWFEIWSAASSSEGRQLSAHRALTHLGAPPLARLPAPWRGGRVVKGSRL